MKSDKEYYELERRYLKLTDKFDNIYSDHIKIEQSLRTNYDEALRQRNTSRNEFYKLENEHKNLNYFFDELNKNFTDPKFVLPQLNIIDIENYLRKKKLEILQYGKK
jgi:hypothetical protein